MHICAEKDLTREARDLVRRYRAQIERYIRRHPEWAESFSPVQAKKHSPIIVKEMSKVAELCGVGPMAGVAGAIAEFMGRRLARLSEEIIIENGGDIFMHTRRERKVCIFAGRSKFSEKVALKISPSDQPYGIATSSGTVGHSYSAGVSDATVIISGSALLSDALATATANIVKGKKDILKGLDFARKINGVKGVLIILKDDIGIWKCEIEYNPKGYKFLFPEQNINSS